MTFYSRKFQLFFFSILLILSSCTYDRTLIYHKDYDPGKHNELQLNGFYNNVKGGKTFLTPIFFYRDGSVIFMGKETDTSNLRPRISENPANVWGYWSNYKIFDDTIKIETIASYKGRFHHTRSTMIGLISEDTIRFIQDIDRKGKITELNYTVFFMDFNIKPDSTSNWIREKRKFNR